MMKRRFDLVLEIEMMKGSMEMEKKKKVINDKDDIEFI
jgi:hypothetical protein